MRLAERSVNNLYAAIRKLVEDANGQIRLQAAFSLGESKNPEAGTVLATVVGGDSFAVAAALSGVNANNVRSFLSQAILTPRLGVLGVFRDAFAVALSAGDLASLNSTLSVALTTAAMIDGPEWGWEVLGGAFQAIERCTNPSTAHSISRSRKSPIFLAAARSSSTDTSKPLPVRLAATRILGRFPPVRDAEVQLLPSLLASQHPPEIQSAAADALARIADPTVPKPLLAAWPDAAPALRSHILDLLLARPDGVKAVLDAVEKDTIPARFIDAPRRQQLLKHRDSSVRAAKRRASSTSPPIPIAPRCSRTIKT